MNRILSYTFLIVAVFVVYTIINSGCAQIGAPTGGPKDTIPPVLVSANPAMKNTNFSGKLITLTFDEYINVDNIQSNLLVSPYPKKNPTVIYKLKTVTIKLSDTLLANNTYSLNFGNAIKDVDEGNIFKNFTYVFSTGKIIDSLKLSGKVLVAETGLPDSTLLVFLYRNANDSSVQQKKPTYIAKVNSDGTFNFHYLPAGIFRIYALKDDDGSKTYNSKYEEFAFADSDINTATFTGKVRLFASAEEKEEKKKSTSTTTSSKPSKSKDKTVKKFKYTIGTGNQDLLSPLEIDFSQQIKDIDSDKIVLTDTFFHKIKAELTIDSTRKKVFITPKWTEATNYRLIIDSTVATDSTDQHLAKNDTVKFRTKQVSEYGSILFRFSDIDYSKHPVLLLLQKDVIVRSIPIKAPQWSDPIFPPGEYELRILYDTNDNGKWDPGNYSEKRQPEKVISLDKKLVIKADWDNEREIQL